MKLAVFGLLNLRWDCPVDIWTLWPGSWEEERVWERFGNFPWDGQSLKGASGGVKSYERAWRMKRGVKEKVKGSKVPPTFKASQGTHSTRETQAKACTSTTTGSKTTFTARMKCVWMEISQQPQSKYTTRGFFNDLMIVWWMIDTEHDFYLPEPLR